MTKGYQQVDYWFGHQGRMNEDDFKKLANQLDKKR